VVPIALLNSPVDPMVAVRDPQILRQIQDAHGIYFTGGQQARIVQVLMTEDQQHTPALKAIWDLYDAGGVIAGSSAGAAVMSQIMCREMGRQLNVLEHGITSGKETSPGLGFLPSDWFVDQHFLIRGRLARALVVSRHHQLPHGLGIDENTALVVRRGRHATVIGYKGVLIIDASKARVDDDEEGFNIADVTLSYLDRGDAIDLATLRVTPSPEKADETELDPNAEDFRPYYDQRMFYTDILGNTTVADLMGRLIDNTESEAVGLAFSGVDARNRPADGFEFRFHRGPDSRGWYTESFGGEDYTVLNIHLDIKPIRISGPLYEPRRRRGGAPPRPDGELPDELMSDALIPEENPEAPPAAPATEDEADTEKQTAKPHAKD